MMQRNVGSFNGRKETDLLGGAQGLAVRGFWLLDEV